MVRIIIACVVIAGTFVVASAFANQDDSENVNSLKAAVRNFNKKAKLDAIGKSQPPLTEEEVIAAIRGWIPKNTPGVTDEVYDQYQKIAESNELPDGSEITSCSGWTGYRGFRFEVWWIDLSIETGKNTGFGFRIRDQKLSSRKLTPLELNEMEKRDRNDLPK